MELQVDHIATIVSILGTVLFVLHRLRTERESLVKWRTQTDGRIAANEKELAGHTERLKKHGDESDKLLEVVGGIKKDLDVFKAEYEKDMAHIKQQLEKLNGNG